MSMGDEGARSSTAGAEAAESLVDDLQPLGGITSKKMFGGYGVFSDSVMFAIVDSTGQCFLRADEATSEKYEAEGGERHGKMPYWTIPASVRDDDELLLTWARDSLELARVAKR